MSGSQWAWVFGATLAVCGITMAASLAQESVAPAPTAKFHRNYYFPGTEALGADEMRVTALGTGLPILRRSQMSSGWLVELGNGEVFLFDLGTGSQLNFVGLQISYRLADKVFLSHLHTDHAGDFAELWIGGWVSGRFDRPLRVWGPSGSRPELGTKYFVDGQRRTWTWDVESRHGKLPARGADVEVHEFDHTERTLVYDVNGVKVWAFPAYHIMEGPVSFRLEWNGRSFVFSGDTTPNQFFVDSGKNADIVVHEVFPTVGQIMRNQGWDERTATQVATVVHTSPAQAGRIFSMTAPRLAVGYHFYHDFETASEIEREVRSTYAGPLALASDLMVFNVTKDDIRVRKAVVPGDTWPEMLSPKDYANAKRLPNAVMPEWLEKARLLFQ